MNAPLQAMVPCVCSTERVNLGINPETEEEEEVDVVTLACHAPKFNGQFPIETRVAVALNGLDFVTLQNTSVIIHNAGELPQDPNTQFTMYASRDHGDIT